MNVNVLLNENIFSYVSRGTFERIKIQDDTVEKYSGYDSPELIAFDCFRLLLSVQNTGENSLTT